MKFSIHWPTHSRFFVSHDGTKWISVDDAEYAILGILAEASIMSRALRDIIQSPNEDNKKEGEKVLKEYRKTIGLGIGASSENTYRPKGVKE